jgi:predicted ferric reductase
MAAAAPQEKFYVHRMQSRSSSLFALLALLLAIFPSVMKMYETSHWFREGDPSQYDEAKDWFDNPKLPYEGTFQSPKVLMRVYFFIVPYMLSSLALLVVALIPRPGPPSQDSSRTTAKSKPLLVGRSLLRRTLQFPRFLVKIGSPLRISVGEILGVSALLVFNLGTFVVRVKRSYTEGEVDLNFLQTPETEPLDPFSWQACEVWAKTLGVLSILNLGWYLLMPIGRRSVLLEALGLSWERAVKYHRWVGFYTVSLMVIHSFMWFGVWIHGDGHPTYDPDGVMLKHNLVPWGCAGTGECSESQTYQLRINMYGIVALLLVLVMTGFALPWARRNKFERFYYMHHLFLPLLLFTCLHYPGSLVYLIPGIAIYSVDKVMGLLAYKRSVKADMRMVSSDVLEVSVKLGKNVRYHAGQYVFLNVPEISYQQWHPFSVTSAPSTITNVVAGTDRIVFHLKRAGTWTRDVVECAAQQQQQQQQVRVRLDGFYGHHQLSQLEHYKDGAILVGGGIGVTPMMSLAMGLLGQTCQKVTLIWVVRTIDEFQIFSKDICQARQRYGSRFTVKVWITLSRPEPMLPLKKHDHDTEIASGAGVDVDRATMKELSLNDQFLRVVNAVQSTHDRQKANIIMQDEDEDETKSIDMQDDNDNDSESCFVPAGLSNVPAANSLVMLVAIWMGLNSYAFGSWLVAEKSKKIDDPKEKGSILDLFLLGVFLLITIAFSFVVIRPLVARYSYLSQDTETTNAGPAEYSVEGKSDSVEGKDRTDRPESSSDASRAEESSASATEEREEPSASEERIPLLDILQGMLEGRICCRPNLDHEFSEASVESIGQADIGVVACGPIAIIQEINAICNAGSFSWGQGKEDAFFAFTEDDWEW